MVQHDWNVISKPISHFKIIFIIPRQLETEMIKCVDLLQVSFFFHMEKNKHFYFSCIDKDKNHSAQLPGIIHNIPLFTDSYTKKKMSLGP